MCLHADGGSSAYQSQNQTALGLGQRPGTPAFKMSTPMSFLNGFDLHSYSLVRQKLLRLVRCNSCFLIENNLHVQKKCMAIHGGALKHDVPEAKALS